MLEWKMPLRQEILSFFTSNRRFWRRSGKFGLFLVLSGQTFNVNEELNGGFY